MKIDHENRVLALVHHKVFFQSQLCFISTSNLEKGKKSAMFGEMEAVNNHHNDYVFTLILANFYHLSWSLVNQVDH